MQPSAQRRRHLRSNALTLGTWRNIPITLTGLPKGLYVYTPVFEKNGKGSREEIFGSKTDSMAIFNPA